MNDGLSKIVASDIAQRYGLEKTESGLLLPKDEHPLAQLLIDELKEGLEDFRRHSEAQLFYPYDGPPIKWKPSLSFYYWKYAGKWFYHARNVVHHLFHPGDWNKGDWE